MAASSDPAPSEQRVIAAHDVKVVLPKGGRCLCGGRSGRCRVLTSQVPRPFAYSIYGPHTVCAPQCRNGTERISHTQKTPRKCGAKTSSLAVAHVCDVFAWKAVGWTSHVRQFTIQCLLRGALRHAAIAAL